MTGDIFNGRNSELLVTSDFLQYNHLEVMIEWKRKI